MKLLSSVLSLLFYFSSNGQENKSCEIINALLNHEKARKIFYFDSHKEVPIVIVDVNNYFQNCTISDYYFGRKIEIVHDSSYIEVANYSNIIIHSLPKAHNKYRITVYYKVRNAFFEVGFKKKKGKIIVSNFTGGHF